MIPPHIRFFATFATEILSSQHQLKQMTIYKCITDTNNEILVYNL